MPMPNLDHTSQPVAWELTHPDDTPPHISTSPKHVLMWRMLGKGFDAVPLYRGKPNMDLPVDSETPIEGGPGAAALPEAHER